MRKYQLHCNIFDFIYTGWSNNKFVNCNWLYQPYENYRETLTISGSKMTNIHPSIKRTGRHGKILIMINLLGVFFSQFSSFWLSFQHFQSIFNCLTVFSTFPVNFQVSDCVFNISSQFQTFWVYFQHFSIHFQVSDSFHHFSVNFQVSDYSFNNFSQFPSFWLCFQHLQSLSKFLTVFSTFPVNFQVSDCVFNISS